jgi:hypothetical protein
MYKRTTKFRWLLAITLALVLTFSTVSTVQAFEFIEDGDLPAGETVDDDLFIVGDNVVIDGTVNGDLFAFGQNVVVNGTVRGSLIVGGQFVEINGQIDGSVYNGCNAATYGAEADIGRNLYFGGFSLDVDQGATIGRDMAFGGYQAVLDGSVGRDLFAGAGALEINGSIGGDVSTEVGSPSDDMGPTPFISFMPPGTPAMLNPGLRISEDAQIGGTVYYTSSSDQGSSIESAPSGGIVFSTPQPDEVAVEASPDFADAQEEIERVSLGLKVGKWLLQRGRELVTLLLLGGLVLWLLPDLFKKVIDKAEGEPLPATGYGFLAVIIGYAGAVIVAALILALGIFFGVLTLGGLGRTIFGVGFSSLGLAVTIFLLLVNYGSKLVLAFWGGQWLLSKLAPQASESKVWPLVVGVLIYVLLRAIPFLGWVIGLVVTLIGLGAMWLVFRDWRKPTVVAAEIATS